MRARALPTSRPDALANFALAYAAAAAFVLLLTGDPLAPFLAVGIAALPYAAAPRQRIAFRGVAAALLLAFPFFAELPLWIFAPSALALAGSIFLLQETPDRRGRRRRR